MVAGSRGKPGGLGLGDEAGKGSGISFGLGHYEEIAIVVDTVVKILIIFAQESARVIARRVDYDNSVIVVVLACVFEGGDYIEFPAGEVAVCELFKEESVF